MQKQRTGAKKRAAVLFRRDFSIEAEWKDGSIMVYGMLKDSFHEMEAEARFSFPALAILDFKGKLIRYPHDECFDASTHLAKLKDLNVTRHFYSKMMERTGGIFGCAHMNNLIYEMGMSAVQARFAKFDQIAPPDFEKLPKAQKIKTYLKFMPGIKNTCHAWSENSPMVKAAEALED